MLVAAQYWKMERSIYERGEPPFFTKLTPEFCFGHWSTQCRSAFQVLIGHFPSCGRRTGLCTCRCIHLGLISMVFAPHAPSPRKPFIMMYWACFQYKTELAASWQCICTVLLNG